jgi:hypothetical protein
MMGRGEWGCLPQSVGTFRGVRGGMLIYHPPDVIEHSPGLRPWRGNG